MHILGKVAIPDAQLRKVSLGDVPNGHLASPDLDLKKRHHLSGDAAMFLHNIAEELGELPTPCGSGGFWPGLRELCVVANQRSGLGVAAHQLQHSLLRFAVVIPTAIHPRAWSQVHCRVVGARCSLRRSS
jgi:hypothetical protein